MYDLSVLLSIVEQIKKEKYSSAHDIVLNSAISSTGFSCALGASSAHRGPKVSYSPAYASLSELVLVFIVAPIIGNYIIDYALLSTLLRV